MPPEQKIKVAIGLSLSARELKATGLRNQHPDWTEKEIQKRVSEIFLYAIT